MTPEERIAAAVERMRLIWMLMLLLASIGTLAFLPWWYLIFLIPFGAASYFGMLTIVLLYLSAAAKDDEIRNYLSIMLEERYLQSSEAKLQEIHEKLESGEVQPGAELANLLAEAGFGEIAAVDSVSPQIGTLDGKPIYEWVEFHDPRTNKKERFRYCGPAANITEEAGRLYANVDGVLYTRDKS